MTQHENPNAFPFAAECGHPGACGGMTLRDWFAGQALAGVLAHPKCGEIGDDTAENRLRTAIAAQEAYAAADAMIAARASSSKGDEQ